MKSAHTTRRCPTRCRTPVGPSLSKWRWAMVFVYMTLYRATESVECDRSQLAGCLAQLKREIALLREVRNHECTNPVSARGGQRQRQLRTEHSTTTARTAHVAAEQGNSRFYDEGRVQQVFRGEVVPENCELGSLCSLAMRHRGIICGRSKHVCVV
jgi:hypothetical protein